MPHHLWRILPRTRHGAVDRRKSEDARLGVTTARDRGQRRHDGSLGFGGEEAEARSILHCRCCAGEDATGGEAHQRQAERIFIHQRACAPAVLASSTGSIINPVVPRCCTMMSPAMVRCIEVIRDDGWQAVALRDKQQVMPQRSALSASYRPRWDMWLPTQKSSMMSCCHREAARYRRQNTARHVSAGRSASHR